MEQSWNEQIDFETKYSDRVKTVFRFGETFLLAELTSSYAEQLEQITQAQDVCMSTCLDWMEQGMNVSYCLLFYHAKEDEKLVFFSDEKDVRALEFVDFLVPEFGLSKGTARCATGQVSTTVLSVQMKSLELNELSLYLKRRVEEYFQNCDHVDAASYVKDHEEILKNFKIYDKQRIAWAYVPTNEIAPSGTKLCIKSLENVSGNMIIAGEDSVVMIGCRGEVYDMNRTKFDKTYDSTEEPLDIFEQMMEFIPEIQLEDGTFVTLDEIARLCYPKQGNTIYARPVQVRTKVFPTYANGDYFLALPGDYLAVRTDDLTDVYVIRQDIFEQTYCEKEE